MDPEIVLIGAGNLATHLGKALHDSGLHVAQVYSRTEKSARPLAEAIAAEPITALEQVTDCADLYLYAVKDDALPEVIRGIPSRKGVHAHTAGSVPMSVFEGMRGQYGVFYPLQTFSKEKPVNFRAIPVFLEASTPSGLALLHEVAARIADRSFDLDSRQRETLHVASVFACNFANHLWSIASDLLAEERLPFDVLMPLIGESVAKLHTLPPAKAQTGPAARGDQNVIARHLEHLAAHPQWQELYRTMTELIRGKAAGNQAETAK